MHEVQIDADHNYNKDSREAVYAWFGKWFLGEEDATKFKEVPFEVEKGRSLAWSFITGNYPNTHSMRKDSPVHGSKVLRSNLQRVNRPTQHHLTSSVRRWEMHSDGR